MKNFYLLLGILFSGFVCFAQAPNTWTQKANFGAGALWGGVGFSISTKGYIGTGGASFGGSKIFWEWNQVSNTWSQKADFPGVSRKFASGFAMGNYGYIGTGFDSNGTLYTDFYQWSQSTNTWRRIADYPKAIYAGVGVSDGTSIGIIGWGTDAGSVGNDAFYIYNYFSDTWNYLTASENGSSVGAHPTAFFLNGRFYFQRGTQFREYNGNTNTWTQKAFYPGSATNSGSVSFAIGNKGYVGTGDNSGAVYKDFWEWDQVSDTWTRKSDFGGIARTDAVGFAISNKGYIGTGCQNYISGPAYDDFWEYYPGIINSGYVASPLCQGNSFNISFTSPDTFSSNNIFSVQLSNSSGSFSSPTIVGSITATTSGVISVTIPANTPQGFLYRIRVVSSNPAVIGNDNGTNITINARPVLNLKFFTQGYYVNGGTLKKVLYNEKVESNSLSTKVDTVVVELHNSVSPYTMVESFKGVLQTNGTIACNFSCNITGHSYYIAVKHRNTIQTWSASPVAFSSTTSYDFTTAANKAYGNNMIQMEPGRWAFYTGDINQDDNIDIVDFPLLDYGIVNGLSGYYASDLNGDGNVDLLDFPILNVNINAGISSMHP